MVFSGCFGRFFAQQASHFGLFHDIGDPEFEIDELGGKQIETEAARKACFPQTGENAVGFFLVVLRNVYN